MVRDTRVCVSLLLGTAAAEADCRRLGGGGGGLLFCLAFLVWANLASFITSCRHGIFITWQCKSRNNCTLPVSTSRVKRRDLGPGTAGGEPPNAAAQEGGDGRRVGDARGRHADQPELERGDGAERRAAAARAAGAVHRGARARQRRRAPRRHAGRRRRDHARERAPGRRRVLQVARRRREVSRGASRWPFVLLVALLLGIVAVIETRAARVLLRRANSSSRRARLLTAAFRSRTEPLLSRRSLLCAAAPPRTLSIVATTTRARASPVAATRVARLRDDG